MITMQHRNSDLSNNVYSSNKIVVNFEGNFDRIKHKELRVSTRSLKAIRITLIILVGLMLTVALLVSVIHYCYASTIPNIANVTQIVCLWAFPIIIYSYFSFFFLTRSSYCIEITPTELIHHRFSKSDHYAHSEIFAALRVKPILRNRKGVWLPTLSSKRILLSENDTLPGKPFIDDVLTYYGVEMPRDPYGTDRNTFTSLGFVLIFLVGPVFLYLGYMNSNINSLVYSIYIMIFVDIIGVILLIVSAKTNKSYKFNKTEFDDSQDLDDLYYDFDEFIDVEEEEQQTESGDQSQNTNDTVHGKPNCKK